MNNLQIAEVSRFHADPKKSQERRLLGESCTDSRNWVGVLNARLAVVQKKKSNAAGAKMATLLLGNVLCHSGDSHPKNELDAIDVQTFELRK